MLSCCATFITNHITLYGAWENIGPQEEEHSHTYIHTYTHTHPPINTQTHTHTYTEESKTHQCVICSKTVGGRVCKYVHESAIHNVLTQGRTVQKGGSNHPNSPANHTLKHTRAHMTIAWEYRTMDFVKHLSDVFKHLFLLCALMSKHICLPQSDKRQWGPSALRA